MKNRCGTVLFLITRMDQRGGAQNYLIHLALGVQRLGWKVKILAGATGPLCDQLEEAGIQCEPLPGLCRGFSLKGDYQAFQALRRYIREERPDIISAHTSKAAFLGRLAGWREKIPVSATPHGLRIGRGISLPIRLAVYLSECVVSRLGQQEVIMVSRAEAQLAKRGRCIPPSRLRVIPIGLPDVPPTASQNNRDPVVRLAMVARFQAPKDHITLMQALRLLPADTPRWSLHLAGDGPEKERVEEVFRKSFDREQVEFAGEVEDVSSLLNKVDLLILSSRSESFPLSLLEGMRAGLPILATKVGGIGEMVEEGVTGLLVPPANPEAMARALSGLLADADRRRKMGEEGRRRFQKLFGLDAMITATVHSWETLDQGSEK